VKQAIFALIGRFDKKNFLGDPGAPLLAIFQKYFLG
jgi:hypothetical protein